ncbi:NUDIX hydrolase [Paractinoplanes durhamensis]|uniref:Nudix hydrolase domain-containing protein n=1 Tax=Paractinoplanes durhamensis TaxID=113563 RepID=A0ABQ3Z617_9ACTN|nr:NUDIX domain-containing protein [Actinoplanes durhamensis]GIE05236.1 hypothetical protein Adu01nite_65860 [Actinoplanes durhamensis]
MSGTGCYRRRSARVILLDSSQRVLLLKFFFDSADIQQGHGWVTPGGGVTENEPLPDAAARELHEEIGLRVRPDALGRPIAYTTGYADLGWANGRFRDDFFLHRVSAHHVDTAGMEALERSHHAGHRWWSLDELTGTSDIVYPFGLAPLLQQVVTAGIPPQPVQLPWHH